MKDEVLVSANDYLQDTQSVLYSGKLLLSALDADSQQREYAITQLEQAVKQQDTRGASFRAFMFTEPEQTIDTSAGQGTLALEGTLTSIITDLHVADVLLTAGQTLGEVQTPTSDTQLHRQTLEGALMRLENKTRDLGQTLLGVQDTSTDSVVPTGHLSFIGALGAEVPTASANIEKAKETFNAQATKALKDMLEDTKQTVGSVFVALDKLDKDKILEALGKLGEQVGELPKVGRLFGLGIEKVRNAFHALIGLVSTEALKNLKERVTKFWTDVKAGTYTETALRWFFQVEAAEGEIIKVLGLANLEQASLDRASDALAQLAAAFKGNMNLVESLLKIVSVVGSLVTLVFHAALLAVTAVIVLILAVILVIGRNYFDTDHLFHRVRGFADIISSVQPAPNV